MKRNGQFLLRSIAGEYILVPAQGDAAGKSKLAILNETAADIYKILENNCTEQQIIDQMLRIYDAAAEEMTRDVHETLQLLLELNAIDVDDDGQPMEFGTKPED